MLVQQSNPLMNKRQHSRRGMVRPATLQLEGSRYWLGSTIDLSNGGASVELEDNIDIPRKGNIGTLWLSDEEDVTRRVSVKNGRNIPCQIVRVAEKRVAISFTDPDYALAQLNAVLLARF